MKDVFDCFVFRHSLGFEVGYGDYCQLWLSPLLKASKLKSFEVIWGVVVYSRYKEDEVELNLIVCSDSLTENLLKG